ncbi:hypothetical protein AGLY_004549 [Aphis glycines]|uniref:Uncharacterized protein n=1 Tax=Aphis glycines TaxID=307491 RepID=A0A6G0TYW7_APHGL|nr:hypothetical protein AGLY_004549 [Aphis glycines]
MYPQAYLYLLMHVLSHQEYAELYPSISDLNFDNSSLAEIKRRSSLSVLDPNLLELYLDLQFCLQFLQSSLSILIMCHHIVIPVVLDSSSDKGLILFDRSTLRLAPLTSIVPTGEETYSIDDGSYINACFNDNDLGLIGSTTTPESGFIMRISMHSLNDTNLSVPGIIKTPDSGSNKFCLIASNKLQPSVGKSVLGSSLIFKASNVFVSATFKALFGLRPLSFDKSCNSSSAKLILSMFP